MNYIEAQFAKLGREEETSVRIRSSDGKTHWMRISHRTMMEIRLAILMQQEREIDEIIQGLGL